MKKMLFLALVLTLPALVARAHEAHVHGLARLDLTVAEGMVEARLETPLANLISFEHVPENESQIQEVRRMTAVLRAAESWLMLPEKAECRVEQVSLASDVLADELLAGGPETGAKPDAAGQAASRGHGHAHADLEATVTFLCARPDRIDGVDIGLFSLFSGVHDVDVQMVTPKGQAGARLTPRSGRVTW